MAKASTTYSFRAPTRGRAPFQPNTRGRPVISSRSEEQIFLRSSREAIAREYGINMKEDNPDSLKR